MIASKNHLQRPQIKICGLTDPAQAAACAEMGADAVGFVFYPPSPRSISIEQAQAICSALPAAVGKVGVFVNPDTAALRDTVERCGLTRVQLHGQEPPSLVQRLQQEKIPVIKALFETREPFFADRRHYPETVFLLECGRGNLPGGNAMQWQWGSAAAFGGRPFILAGGLDPQNVGEALTAAAPDAVDVSSGVEDAPGRKNMDKVAAFIEAVHAHPSQRPLRRIF